MHTAGLDLSLTGTGVCVLLDGVSSLSTIATEPKQFRNRYDRIDMIADKCFDLVDEADLVAIEAGFVHVRNISNAVNIVALNFMVRRALTHAGVQWVEVAPSQLKKFITGKGRGEKSLILREVWRRWQIEAADDNQADAAGLAHLAKTVLLDRAGNTTGIPDFQLEIARKVTSDAD